MFEHYSKPLIPRAAYHRRLVGAVGLSLLLSGVSLLAGMFGYHEFEHMSWVDAYLWACWVHPCCTVFCTAFILKRTLTHDVLER